MKTIFRNESAFGGFECEVTADETVAHIKVRSPHSNNFKIVRKISRKEFDQFAAESGLFDMYDKNPAKIFRLVDNEEI